MSKGNVCFYHFAIVKYDKTVALHMLNMFEPYLMFKPYLIVEHRHTETLLPEICQRERYGSNIFNMCKATVLSYLTIAK